MNMVALIRSLVDLFVACVRRRNLLGHVMEHIAIELQNVAGSPVTFGRTRSIDGEKGHYNMVFQYLDAEVGREASRLSA